MTQRNVGDLIEVVGFRVVLVTRRASVRVPEGWGDCCQVVRIPDVPSNLEFDEDGTHTATLWNEGYLAWDEVVGATPAPSRTGSAADLVLDHHTMTSNEVVVTASVLVDGPVDPPQEPGDDPELPDTGSPAFLGLLAAVGGALLALGVLLVGRGRRRGGASS